MANGLTRQQQKNSVATGDRQQLGFNSDHNLGNKEAD